MKNTLLLPNRFKMIGWVLFLITTVSFLMFWKLQLGPAFLNFDYGDDNNVVTVNLLKEIIFTFWTASLVLICFSKEKQEDEYVSFLRLSSWQYAVLASLIISVGGTWIIYGWNYLTFSAFNMLTAPLAFILIFTLKLSRFRKEGIFDEK